MLSVMSADASAQDLVVAMRAIIRFLRAVVAFGTCRRDDAPHGVGVLVDDLLMLTNILRKRAALDPAALTDAADSKRGVAYVLATISSSALVVRLAGVGWGLPALYDPDEPLFMLCALKLLREATVDPGWFGHPGTTTIYGIALVEAATYLGGHMAGVFASPAAFVRAIYLDPRWSGCPRGC